MRLFFIARRYLVNGRRKSEICVRGAESPGWLWAELNLPFNSAHYLVRGERATAALGTHCPPRLLKTARSCYISNLALPALNPIDGELARIFGSTHHQAHFGRPLQAKKSHILVGRAG